MRRIIILLAAAALAFSATTIPALADQPADFVIEATETDTDPCTGEAMTIYATFTGRAHEHSNNSVVTIDSYATTSNGYVGNGTETTLTIGDKFISTFNWVAVNPDTDARILVKGRFHIDLGTGDVKRAGVELRCAGGGAA